MRAEVVFDKLGKKVKGFLGREDSLEALAERHRQDRTPFLIGEPEMYQQLRPASACLDEARSQARAGRMDRASQALLEHFQQRIRPRCFIHHDEAELVVPAFEQRPALVRYLLSLGERVLAHEFAPMGTEPHTFPTTIDWFSDFHGSSWVFAHVEDLREQLPRHAEETPDLGPIELTWEFNRLGHLVDLGRAYWLSGSEPFVSEYIVQAVDWSERNPPLTGVNWLDPETVAARSVNWMLAMHFFLKSPQLAGEVFARLLRYLLLHGAVLAEMVEREERGALACASALYLLGQDLPEANAAPRWVELAQDMMTEAARQEFGSDGFHASGSTARHRLALEWLLLPLMFHHLNGSVAPAALRKQADVALESMISLLPPAGQMPEIGPGWPGGFLAHQGGPTEHTRNLIALGALTTGREDLRALCPKLPADLHWWAGTAAAQQYARLAAREPAVLRRVFPEAGMAVARENWTDRSCWCLLRSSGPNLHEEAAELLPTPPARMPFHDDQLALCVALDGEPVLVEPGAPPTLGPLYDAFAQLGAHTAPRVGREREPLAADASVQETLRLEPTREGLYLHARRPVWLMPDQPWTLSREVLLQTDRKRLILRDSLEGRGEVHLETNLLLAPHLDVLMRGDMGCLLRGEKLQARLIPLFPSRFRYELYRGRKQPFAGWIWSGRPVPAHLLRYYARLQAPAVVYLWFAWNPDDTAVPKADDLERLFSRSTGGRCGGSSPSVWD